MKIPNREYGGTKNLGAWQILHEQSKTVPNERLAFRIQSMMVFTYETAE